MRPEEPRGRIHSMDALRASTMLLLVPVHAAALLSENGHPGAWATAVYWLVHVFRLPLFFAMSAFFLAFVLQRKGLSATLRNRTVRIAVPLLVGILTVVPLTTVLAEMTGTSLTVEEGAPHGTPFTFEPGYLWFLWYLLLLDCAGLALHIYAPRALASVGRLFRIAVARPLVGIALLSVPTAIALWPAANWTAGTPVDTFVPSPSVLAYYTLFFALGATLCIHRELIAVVSRDAWRWSACALAATVPAALLFTLHNSPGYGDKPEVHAAGLLIYAIATWCSLIALIALTARYVTKPRPWVRYMADAAYWIYLSHMPAVILLVALAGTSTLSTPPAFALVTTGALAFSLLTYPLFVRYTVIGTVLNGPRARPRRSLAGRRTALRGLTG